MAGFIRNTCGTIHFLDPLGMEGFNRERYSTVKAEFDRWFSAPAVADLTVRKLRSLKLRHLVVQGAGQREM